MFYGYFCFLLLVAMRVMAQIFTPLPTYLWFAVKQRERPLLVLHHFSKCTDYCSVPI